jgi:CRISPR-associated protein Csx17
LRGCTPAPLAAYLKALAVLRLVTEQAGDPDASGRWCDDAFVLRTRLTERELQQYFLQSYRPTAILSPWNGRAGFLEGEDAEDSTRKGPLLITRLAASKGTRLADYRQLIEGVRSLPEIAEFNNARAELKELERRRNRGKSVDDEQRKSLAARTKELKTNLLSSLRNRVPDKFLDWIDACLIVGEDKPVATPLLGSGGNEGSMDLSINHVSLLLRLIDPDTDSGTPDAAALLAQALFGVPALLWSDVNLGQLSPGTVGGANMGTGFAGPLVENPWSSVLALEGAVLFNASLSKRLDSTMDPALSFPFLVEAILAGAGGVAWDESARPEIWLPLWDAFSSYAEILALIRESRTTVGRRQAVSALDAARAVAGLGVDRGISAFERFGIFERRGRGYYVATPIGRYVVPKERNKTADLIADLEQRGWLANLQSYAQGTKASSAFRAGVAQLDVALFGLTQRADRVAIQNVLRRLGHVESLCSSSPKTREEIRPVPPLSPEWARRADDGSTEFRIAAALADLSLRGERDGRQVQLKLRPHLAPVAHDGTGWDERSSLVSWGPGALERNLLAVLRRRRLEAVRLNAESELLTSLNGAALGDVHRFIEGDTDDRCITELLAGLVCADLSTLDAPRDDSHTAPLPAYALLKVLFTPESTLRYMEWLPVDRSVRLPAEIPARLAANNVGAALELAWQSLHSLGVRLPGREPPQATALNGPRLLAALMIPLTPAHTRRLLHWLNVAPEIESSSQAAIEDHA